MISDSCSIVLVSSGQCQSEIAVAPGKAARSRNVDSQFSRIPQYSSGSHILHKI
jgi:hypothetical protein